MKNEGSFYNRVFEVVRQVPSGRITTYGAIARYLGSAQSSRMVGWAMNQSHFSETYVPAHRVVNRLGLLTGKHHFDGPNVMEELLQNEGIEIANNQVIGFEKYFWDPSKELSL